MNTEIYTYENPFYNKNYSYSQKSYTTEKEPILYKGYMIFKRNENVYDVVINNKIISQRVTESNCKMFIDSLP